MDELRALFAPGVWVGYVRQATHGLLVAIPVALVFEVFNALSLRFVLARLAPAMNRDAARDPAQRARRRRQLRDYCAIGLRWLWYTGALLVLFALWHLDPLAVGLVIAAMALLFRGLLANAVSSWSLLLDDCAAPGDRVLINGTLTGAVAECGMRRLKLTDDQGRAWWIRCSDISTVQVMATAVATPSAAEPVAPASRGGRA